MFRASDLEGGSYDGPSFIVPSMVPEGVSLLSGTPKIGKSWMALNMGVAVATGGVFLEQSCTPGEVLYLALEDNQRRLQSRLRLLMGWDPFPKGLTFSCSWPRFPLGVRELEKILRLTPYRLVLIDTLEMVRPPRRSNSYEDDYKALSGLSELATEHRCAFVVVHHNRKGTADDVSDPLELVSGTMGLTGSVDSVLVLSRVRNTQLGSLAVMGRDVEEACLTVQFVKELGLWQVYNKGLESGVYR